MFRVGSPRNVCMLHLQEEADKRQVPWEPTPGSSVTASAHWLQHLFRTVGPILQCATCQYRSRDCLLCTECDVATCRSCLQVGKGELFNVRFSCIACAVSGLPYQFDKTTKSSSLQALHRARIQTLGARLKPGTWHKYQAWISTIQNFMLTHRGVIFPILCDRTANAFTYFLQFLKEKSYSWGYIRSCPSAVRAFQRSILGISAELADPFKRLPILEMMCASIHRTVSTVVRQRKPLPGAIVVVFVSDSCKSTINGFLQRQEWHGLHCGMP